MYDLVCFIATRLTCSYMFSTFNLNLGIAYNLVDFTYYNCSRAGHVLYDLGSGKKRHFVFSYMLFDEL